MAETMERINHWPEYAARWEFSGDAEDAVRVCGSLGGYEARMQYEFMVGRGLLPSHRFLDLGCGCLRGTIRLVDYLEDGNFYGADVSVGLLKEAYMECERQKYAKTPVLGLISDFDLATSLQAKFDYILCVSMLPYLSADDVPDLFTGIASVLAPKGRVFLTLYPLDEKDADNHRQEPYLNWHKKSWLISGAAKAGISLIDSPERFMCRLPRRGPPILKVVNSNLSEWVLEGTLA